MEPEEFREYQEYATITEEIFKELLKFHRDKLGGVKPIPNSQNKLEAYSIDDIKRIFEQGRTSEYHKQLETHIKRLYAAHQKQMNKKIIDKEKEIGATREQLERQIQSSRVRHGEILHLRQRLNEEEEQFSSIKKALSESRRLKEWDLARHLFEQSDNSEQKAWIRGIEAQFIRMKGELDQIHGTKLNDCGNDEERFVANLFEACKVDHHDREAVIMYERKLKSDKIKADEEVAMARTMISNMEKAIEERQAALANRQRRLAEEEQNAANYEVELARGMSQFDQEKESFIRRIRQLEKQIEQMLIAKHQSDVDSAKFREVQVAISDDGLTRRQQLDIILRYYTEIQRDEQVERLADDWQDSRMANENSLTLQRLIYVRLAQQKTQLIEQSGLYDQFRLEKDRIGRILAEVIKISILTISEIEELIFDKLLGIRYEPINVRLNLDLDSVVETLAREYHKRISCISQRVSQMRKANQRRTVEYVMKEPIRE